MEPSGHQCFILRHGPGGILRKTPDWKSSSKAAAGIELRQQFSLLLLSALLSLSNMFYFALEWALTRMSLKTQESLDDVCRSAGENEGMTLLGL